MYNVRVIEIEKRRNRVTTMFKKFASVALSSIFMAGAMMATDSGNNSADAHSYKKYNWNYNNYYNCSGGKVYVNTSHAWFKTGPSLRYPTMRTLGWNTALWVTNKNWGYGYSRYGWIPVKTADGAHGFVHRSRVGCTAGAKWSHNWNHKHAWNHNYKWNHKWNHKYGYGWNRHAYWNRHMCNRVRVSAPYAWLKKYPTVKSRTLATAWHGEPLMRVGHHHKNGWWLYARGNGTRYWVHNSVVSCDTMKTMAAPAPVKVAPKKPVRRIASCMDVLQCASDTANAATAGQYKQWLKQVKDMMSNPLTKLAGEELCKNTMEKPITDALPGCKRNG